jgi:LysM domain
MSLDGIYNNLNGALHDGNITLDGTVLAGLTELLTQLGVPSLAVTSASLSLGPAAVLLSGAANFRSRAYTATLTGESPGGVDKLTLKLQGSGIPPTLRELFGQQPPSRIAAEEGYIILADSVLDPLVVTNPNFVAANGLVTAHFKGSLQITAGSLAQYATFLLADRLDLDGAVTFPAVGLPTLELEAVAPASKIGLLAVIPGVVENAGLVLSNQGVDEDLPRVGLPLSIVDFFATITNPAEARLTVPLLRGDGLWPLKFAFAGKGLSLQGGLDTIASFFGGAENEDMLALPPGIDLFKDFYISSLELGVDPGLPSDLPALIYSTLTITSDEPWNSPVPFITLTKIGTQWMFRWPQTANDTLITTGSVFGTFVFGKKQGQPASGWSLDAVAYLPQFDIWVSSNDPLTIPIGDAIGQFFQLQPADTPGNLTVTEINILAQMAVKTLAANMVVQGDWSITVNRVTFRLEQIAFEVVVTQQSVTGALEGLTSIQIAVSGVETTKAVFLVRAEYPGAGNWIFSGGLVDGTLLLVDFVAGFLGMPEPPSWTGGITLQELKLRYDTGPGHPYFAQGKATASWDITDALGIKLALEAAGKIEKTAGDDTDETHLSGEFSGSFQINQIKVTAGLSFKDATKTYFFLVEWDDKQLKAVASETTTGKSGQHYVLTITLRGFTVGGLLESIVNLINPNLNYHLDAPWDFLNSVDLSRFSLLLDPTENRIELNFRVDLGVTFMRVDSVGVVYDRSTGDPSVRFKLTGQFLDKTYTDDKPLTWDAINDAPPEIPGQGTKLLDVRYLGLGQHVTLTNMTQYQTVADVIDALRAQMLPPTNPNANPLSGQSQLVFAPDSQWLIGLDLTILEFIRIGIVFNDPKLYGLVIALNGPGAKSLSGLSFELLYKKVTDDIGVFRVRLQVPDAFRQIDFGAVSVTLGIITVDIFTNGNFRIDLGFPENRNFENSFGLQMGPFIGRGGIYFAVLNGATSTRVPAVTNGTFSPVIELGIGVAVGLGRTFNKGPLKAGLYVELEAIFIGVLAWFHPNDAARDTSLYYWCRGTAALSGKLYGKVDFKIISVSVSVEAFASVSLTLEAYLPMLVELDVGVEVDAEVEFLFFSVSFSFHINLHASFTIGEARPTPWILAADQSGRNPRRLVQSTAAPQRRRASDMVRLTRSTALNATTTVSWNPDIFLFSDNQPVAVNLTMLPVLPVAAIPVNWGGSTPSPVTIPSYQLAFMLTAAVPGTKNGQDQEVSFNNLVQIALRWSITGVGLAPFGATVTPAALASLATLLDDSQAADSGFSYSNLDTLFNKNLRLQVDGRPASPTPSSGVAFPMVPNLGWQNATLPNPDQQTRAFDSYLPVDSTYEKELRDYLNRLLPGDHLPAPPGPPGVESMATFVFRDYFLLIAKSAVDEAQQLIASLSYAKNLDRSLNQIASDFLTINVTYVKADGDNVDQVAFRYGYSAGELEFLNPGITQQIAAASAGTSLTVKLGVTPQSIVVSNAGLATSGGSWSLGDLPYQIRENDTLDAIATRYGLNVKNWLNWSAQPGQEPEMLAQVRLLRVASTLPLGAAYFFQNSILLTVDQLAAVFFVRLFTQANIPRVEWYAQAIVGLNPGIETDNNGDTTTLPAQVIVPRAFQDLTNPLQWTPLPGDTLLDVAAYFALLQNAAPLEAYQNFRTAMRTSNPGPDFSRIVLPPNTTTSILPAETLGSLGRRLLLDPQGDVFVAVVKNVPLLQSLATVTLRGVVAVVAAGTSFSDLSQRYAISLGELGGVLGSVSSILQSPASIKINVTNLTAINFEDLMSDVLAGSATRISNQVSRFMLCGLRIPKPEAAVDGIYHATGPLQGLYLLTGQQVLSRAPADPPLPPLSAAFNLPGAQKQWIHLGPDIVVGSSGSLTVTVTDADIMNYAPSPSLTPEFTVPLQASKLWLDQPMRWDLQQHLLWQTPTPISLPGPAPANVNPAMPGFWPLPPALLERAGESNISYSLVTLDPNKGPSAPTVPVQRWAWGCLVDFNVRRVPGYPGLNEVLGADTAMRQTLLQAWNYIDSQGAGTGVLTLLYRPALSAGLPGGLVSPSLNPVDGAYLIKENLSTETHSGMQALRSAQLTANTPPAVFAPITDAANFLMLLWECSVVGGGGYWLQTIGPDSSPALPESAYGSDGMANLSLLITINTQTAPAPSRALLSFNNCAIVGDPIDLSAVHLVVQPINDPTAMLRLPTVDPGNVGFEMIIKRPPAPDLTDPHADQANRTKRYYQLAGYDLLPTEAFAGAAASVPVGPQKTPTVAGEPDLWTFMQVIPAARFALSHPLPDLTALPSPALDPYAGIRLVGPPNTLTLGALRTEVWFQDMLGNATDGAPTNPTPPINPGPTPTPAGQLDVPVGYMDPIIGLTSWPALTAAFRVPKPEGIGGPKLVVELGFQPGQYLAGPGEAPAPAIEVSTDHRQRYARIYYQVMQETVAGNLLTSLSCDAIGQPIRLANEIIELRSYTAAAHAFLATTSNLTAVPSAATCHTLNDVVARYGVWFDGLAAANAEVPLSGIFADQSITATDPKIQLPRFVLFQQGDTAAALSTSPAQLLLNNKTLPLRTGVELAFPPRAAQTPPTATTITALATQEKCSVTALVQANVNVKNLLTVGFTFAFADAEVKVGDSDTTLEDVARTFRDDAGVPVSALTLGTTYADTAGVFDLNKTLQVSSYTVLSDETLETNVSGVDTTTLATANTGTLDLFMAGTPIFLDTVDGSAVFDSPLAEAARTFGISGEQLLAFHAITAFASGASLVLPGQSALPTSPTSQRIPYRIADGDMLDVIAQRFLPLDLTDPVQALATANATLPGVLAANKTIQVNQQSVSTIAGDSLQDVADRFNPPVPLADVVNFLRAKPGFLATGDCLLCPPSQSAKASTPSIAAVAALFGIDPTQLALANASITGVLQPNITFTLSRDGVNYTVITAANPDNPGGPSLFTLNSIVTGFAKQNVHTDLAEVVGANETVQAFVPNAPLLLPPPGVTLTADLSSNPSVFPGAIFPIHAWVEIRRSDRRLILPDFQGTSNNPSPTEACRTPVAPKGAPNDNADGDFESALTLADFASDLEEAVSVLRVCTGKVLTDEGGNTDVWAIGFGPQLIEQVSVHPPPTTTPAPQFFALRPLFNHLVTRQGVMVSPLKEDGTLDTAVAANFQGIDAETWATDFLTDAELFLSGPYSSPAYRGAARTNLEKVIRAKADLAGAVANGLDYVLELNQPSPSTRPPDWQNAYEFLRQRLLVNLGQAWATEVLLQYNSETQIASRWSALRARLSGVAVKNDSSSGGDGKRVSIAGAKIDLEQPSSYVTFGVSLQKPADADDRSSVEALQSYLSLDLSYAINEVEFNVRPVEQGYEASDWLSFVLPPDQPAPPPGWSLVLGTTKAPLPLRNYPAPAVLVAQGDRRTYPETTDWSKAAFWTYAFTYQHASAAQDQIRLDIVFNEADTVSFKATTTDDLFAALAQYETVRAQLWEILKTLPATAAVTPNTPLANAVATFAALVQRVRDTWVSHWASESHPEWARLALPATPATLDEDSLPQTETYRYVVSLEWTNDAVGNSYYVAFTLQRDAASSGPVGWPQLSVSFGGQTFQLQRGQPVGQQCRYAFPAGSLVPVGAQLNVAVALDALHVANYQKATASVAVIRNANLLGPNGPRTRDGFIFMTPPTTFADPVIPLLVWDAFNIGLWSSEGEPLAAVMSGILGGDVSGNRPVSLLLAYGYELVPNADMRTTLPIYMRPRAPYQSTEAATIAQMLTQWQDDNQPSTVNAEWVFSVAVYSVIDSTDSRPVLEISQLLSPLSGP